MSGIGTTANLTLNEGEEIVRHSDESRRSLG
nr:MAG TPA_asm: hypothetical protein [Caudoviricetes sp.]